MNRRSFIRKAVLTTGGVVGMPYLLPSGRLFSQTNSRIANHVVLVLFAGGIRHQDSIGQRYLDGSQNESIPGNVLYNLLNGDAPEDKIVYGTDGSRPGEIPIPPVLPIPLAQQGTLFQEMRTTQTGHFGGLNVAIQGTNITTQGLRERPLNPTIFEYLRRHAGLPATDVWFVGNGIGNSVPLLNHSTHERYGVKYAANFLAPSITFSGMGFRHLANARVFHPEYELDPMYKMKFFLDHNWERVAETITGIGNTDEEKMEIKAFIDQLLDKTQNNTVTMPPVRDIGDLETIGYTCEVMKHFTPTLTVVNLNNVDTCHGDFTGYLRNLHRIDHGAGFMWDFIQNQIPKMANDTVMIVVPECGRNMDPNPILDANDWYGYDHNDENSRRIFGLMVGKGVPANLTLGSETNPLGESADMCLTVADILGVKETVANQGFVSYSSRSLFDRI